MDVDFPTGTVTFLFTDIEGSTRLLQSLGDRWDEVLNAHHAILREAFGRHGGVEVGTEGDSFFVVFASARSGVDAALAAQRGLAAYEFPECVKVRVRMGIHTGEARIIDGNYRGIDVHRAARIAAAGHGGQILASDTTRALVEGSQGEPVTFTDLGDHRLKELEQPERLFQIRAPGLISNFPPPRSTDSRPSNLTAPVSSFIGRERELRDIKKQLRDNRLVTLTGPGGTGKEPACGAGRPRGALRVPGRRIHGRPGIGQRPRAHRSCRRPKPRSQAAGGSAEQEYPVPPMSLPAPETLADLSLLELSEAVRLFLQRARAVRPNFVLTERNAREIVEICTRLDGLPLALELAAARIRTLEPHEVARRLNHSLSLLTGGPRDLPARQQTLRNTIAWRYELLDEPPPDLLCRLGVFSGGFSLQAAEAVCREDALDLLEQLAEQSMIRTTLDQFGARYHMLAPVREYALECLDQRGYGEQTRRRYAGYFLSLTEQAAGHLQGRTQLEWLGRLELENDNLEAVMAWALATGADETAARLGWNLWIFWWLHGHQEQGRRSMEALLEHDPPEQEKCLALAVARSMALVQGDHESANRNFQASIELARKLGDEIRLAFSLHSWGLSSLNSSDWGTAVACFEEALPLFRKQNNLMMASGTLTNLGTVGYMQGDLDRAEDRTRRGLEIARRLAHPVSTYFALYILSQAALARGDLATSAPLLKEALAAVGEVGNPTRLTYYLQTYGLVLGAGGDHLRAARLLGASEGVRKASGVPHYIYLAAPNGLYERTVPALREALGEERCEIAKRQGRTMSPHQAVGNAIEGRWEESILAGSPFGSIEVEPEEID